MWNANIDPGGIRRRRSLQTLSAAYSRSPPARREAEYQQRAQDDSSPWDAQRRLSVLSPGQQPESEDQESTEDYSVWDVGRRLSVLSSSSSQQPGFEEQGSTQDLSPWNSEAWLSASSLWQQLEDQESTQEDLPFCNTETWLSAPTLRQRRDSEDRASRVERLLSDAERSLSDPVIWVSREADREEEDARYLRRLEAPHEQALRDADRQADFLRTVTELQRQRESDWPQGNVRIPPSRGQRRLSRLWNAYIKSLSSALILSDSTRSLGYLLESLATTGRVSYTSWECGCGTTRRVSVYTAQDLAERLANPNSATVVSASGQSHTGSHRTRASTMGQNGLGTLPQSQSLPYNQGPWIPPTAPTSTNITSTTSQFNAIGTPRFLLLCLNKGKHNLVLRQISCSYFSSDVDLFREIRQHYAAVQRFGLSPFSLVLPVSVHLTKLELLPPRKDSNVGILETPSIPPEDEVIKHKRYHYVPCPAKAESFLVLDDFLHGFFDPCEHTSNYWVERLPKKLLQRLEYRNTWDPAVGWGIHIIEGPNMLAITLILTVMLLLTCLFCILWTTARHGAISDAYGMGSFIMALLSVGLATFYFYWQQPQRLLT